ncbi:MAG: cation:dicarboxylase symporter family transporter [Spirochaetia bacterium]|nr:cation:dicarboxylase symporter family transporter [Spirochaetia bacterium]
MKTWIMYTGAILFGFSATLLLGGWQPYASFITFMVPMIKDLSLFFIFPIVFILFTGESASLRRHKDTSMLFFSTLFWSLITTLVLSFATMGLFLLIPQSYSQFTAVAQQQVPILKSVSFSEIKALLFSNNAFTQFTKSTSSLLPVIVVASIIGYALKPDYEALRPAYVVTNSFSEVAMRLSRIITHIVAIAIAFLSAHFSMQMDIISTLYEALPLFLIYMLVVLVTLFLILPLLYALVTGFRKGNPYKILFNSFASIVTSFFFMSTLESTLSMIALGEHNTNVKKRVAGTAFPLYTLLGKGGSAMIATLSLLFVLQNTGVTQLSFTSLILIALFSSLISLLSSFVPRFEVLFIMMLTFSGLFGKVLETPGSFIIILLPFIQGIAAMIDSSIAILGAAFTSRIISQDQKTPYHQMM